MTQTFKVGDKVTHRTWGAAEVAYGPFLRDGSSDNYLIKQDSDGEHRFVDSEGMTPPPPFTVGDKVRSQVSGTPYTIHAGPFRGHTEWYAVENEARQILSAIASTLELIERGNTVTVDGITYDLTARYRDREDDYWTFKDVDGTVRGYCTSNPDRDLSGFIDRYSDTLVDVINNYGPLTRVDA